MEQLDHDMTSEHEIEEDMLSPLVKELDGMYAGLAGEIYAEFTKRKAARSNKEAEWLQAQALYLGPLAVGDRRYVDTPFVKSVGKRRPGFNIVGPKCDIAHSVLVTTQFGAGDKNWNLRQSAVPEGQGDVVSASVFMERTIDDQLDATNYGKETRDAFWDYVVLGTGIMRGPLNLGKLKKTWQQQGDVFTPIYSGEFVPGVKRVDPWLFFPDPSAVVQEDMDTSIQLHPMTSRQLKELTYNAGFDKETIEELLASGPNKFEYDSKPDNADLTSNTDAWSNRYLILESYWKVPKSLMATRYVTEQVSKGEPLDHEKEWEDYIFCEVWSCNNKILRIAEPQLETCRKPPYYIAAWKKDPGSLFGFGAALTMADQQRVVIEAWHMVLDNAEVSSGPQVAINKAMVEPQDGETYDLKGWKIWNVTEYGTDVRNAIQFFNAPNNQEALMAVLNAARQFADEESGIPLIQGGLEGPGSEGGATGMAIKKQAATAMLYQKASDWDDRVTRPAIVDMYEWNMTFNPNPAIKGDFEVDVMSTTGALKMEFEKADMEKLSVESSNNPALAMVLNLEELTKSRLQAMKLPNSNIVKSPEQIKQAQEEAKNQPNIEMIKLEIEQKRVALEERKLALEEQKLQFENTKNQQRELWEHQERIANTEARNYENQVDSERAKADYDIAMMTLAGKQKIDLATIETKLLSIQQKTAMDQMKLGVDVQTKTQEQALKSREMNIKERTGSGI